jgi:hypothetical protein
VILGRQSMGHRRGEVREVVASISRTTRTLSRHETGWQVEYQVDKGLQLGMDWRWVGIGKAEKTVTCEAKCGAAALDIADRQNVHSMTMTVRGIVELFRLVKREKELYREILAFSISHDHRTVRVYGHYPIIKGNETTFYRHPIRTFDFTELDSKEKWTAYKFTKNVYDIWMPTHLERICSVIDELPPDLDFEVSQQSEPGESGLSQGFRKPPSL